MREKKRAAALALAFALLPAGAGAGADGSSPAAAACCGASIDSYRNYTQWVLAACRKPVRLRPRESVSTGDVHQLRQCIATGTRDSRERFQAALPALPYRPARDALQHYQSIFEAALAGVAPTPDEPVGAYEQRQSSMRHWVAHAWSRFELREKPH